MPSIPEPTVLTACIPTPSPYTDSPLELDRDALRLVCEVVGIDRRRQVRIVSYAP